MASTTMVSAFGGLRTPEQEHVPHPHCHWAPILSRVN
jgi:hypothetical protein